MVKCTTYVMARMLHLYISSPYLAVAGKHVKRHTVCAHKPHAASDWLNPHYLGTMSSLGYIDNLS